MPKPLLSIIVLTYNHEKYIRQCLEGIINQKTNFTFEVIIGEDCSTDGTKNIVRDFEVRYPDIIKPIYHSQNVGAKRNAYEFCFSKVSGQYIALCEGDDYWTDFEKLQKQVDFLEANKDYSVCFHYVNFVNENGEIIRASRPDNKIIHFSSPKLFHISISTPTIVFRNSFQHFKNDLANIIGGDVFLRGILATQGKGACLNFVGACYRKHPGGIYSSSSVFKQFEYSLSVRKKMIHSPLFIKKFKREIQKEYLSRKLWYFMFFIKKGNLRNGIRIIMA